MIITWARFAWYGGRWHFRGFTSDETVMEEFEDSCASYGTPCIVLALAHQEGPRAIPVPRQGWRRTEKVPVRGELL
jgi:hypothetical protein